MPGSTFEPIVKLVTRRLGKRDTQSRRAIPFQKWVAVALWRLTNVNSYRTINRTLAIAKSTAVEITSAFCEEMRR